MGKGGHMANGWGSHWGYLVGVGIPLHFDTGGVISFSMHFFEQLGSAYKCIWLIVLLASCLVNTCLFKIMVEH
jgi:hypothetical protein